MFLVAPTL